MRELRLNEHDYEDAGPEHIAAWARLARGCEVPPSFEVFEAELAAVRRRAPAVAPEVVADRLVAMYRRIPLA
jgi:hypothetical protein